MARLDPANVIDRARREAAHARRDAHAVALSRKRRAIPDDRGFDRLRGFLAPVGVPCAEHGTARMPGCEGCARAAFLTARRVRA